MAIREEQGTSDQNQLDFAQIMATSSMAQINPFNPADPHVKIMLIGKINKLKNKWGGGIDLEKLDQLDIKLKKAAMKKTQAIQKK